jgi:hypothetical protein
LSYSQIFKYVYTNTYNRINTNTIIIPKFIEPIIVKVIKIIPCEVGHKVNKISYIYIKIHI